MKLMVNEMPKIPQECMFSANGTGKYRCRHDAKLCPINRGGECPHLMEIPSPEPVVTFNDAVPPEAVVDAVSEPKKRTTKRSTAKKVSD